MLDGFPGQFFLFPLKPLVTARESPGADVAVAIGDDPAGHIERRLEVLTAPVLMMVVDKGDDGPGDVPGMGTGREAVLIPAFVVVIPPPGEPGIPGSRIDQVPGHIGIPQPTVAEVTVVPLGGDQGSGQLPGAG